MIEAESVALYNHYAAYSQDGSQLAYELETFVKPLFQSYLDAGFSPVEIAAVMQDVIGGVSAELKLRHGITVRKQERESNERE